MHGLEMHLMFCYNEFWICLQIFSLFKSILLYRVNEIMFTAILSNLYCTSIKRPLFKVPTVVLYQAESVIVPYCAVPLQQIGCCLQISRVNPHSPAA